jgi:DNA modification methylase
MQTGKMWPVGENKNLLSEQISIDNSLNRKLVSYQGNKQVPGFRWMKYKEGFSTELVSRLLDSTNAKMVLDPFSGVGTTALVAASKGMSAVGMDIMPVGNMTASAIIAAAIEVDPKQLVAIFSDMLEYMKHGTCETPFNHVRITRLAFHKSTETELARARSFIDGIQDSNICLILNFACMSVLEEVSYTSKDGQFLRWDRRSGRDVVDKLRKGKLPTLSEALSKKVGDILQDLPRLRETYSFPGFVQPEIITASCLTMLKDIPANTFDAVVTSPPYANRYDYTRTYALELAWLGYDQDAFNTLRQQMLSATVENKPKNTILDTVYGDSKILYDSYQLVAENTTLGRIIQSLEEHRKMLNNPQVIRLVKNYFAEMALVIKELSRVLKPGGDVFMVNDNVRYNGVDVPVDLILSEFALDSGFRCESIRTLARGKGNSSQQMGKFGRRELRKCIYHWQKL